jgi:colanic acid/amylovoran biosynthesis protein
MKVCIVNQHTFNHGDESAMRALLRALRSRWGLGHVSMIYNHKLVRDLTCDEAGLVRALDGLDMDVSFRSEITLFDKVLVVLTFVLPVRVVSIFLGLSQFGGVFKKIAASDIVVSAPGGVNIGPYNDWLYLWVLYVAEALGKRTLIYSISIDEAPSRYFMQKAIKVLKKADFLSLRDARSQQVARRYGVPFVSSIDTAYLDSPVESMSETPHENSSFAVFVPNDLPAWHPSYKGFSKETLEGLYVKVLDELVNSFGRVTMLPQLFGILNDSAYFEKLRTRTKYPDMVSVLSPYMSSDEQQRLISNASFLVGARYHSVVFAVNNCIPFLSLSYEHKMSGMLDLLGLSALNYDLQKVTRNDKAVEVLRTLCECIQQREVLREKVCSARKDAKRIAKGTIGELDNAIRCSSIHL